MKRFVLKTAATALGILALCSITGIAEGHTECWLVFAAALIGANAICGALL